MKNKLFILLLVAIAIGLNGYLYFQNFHRSTAVKEVEATGTAAIGTDFVLTDQTGAKLDSTSLRGKYLLVFFGFTHCPAICPATMMTVSDTLGLLGKDADRIAPLFITVDPERDTVSQLADYAKNYDTRIKMLTGTLAEIEAVTKGYRVVHTKVPMHNDNDYMVDHSTLIYLMDKDGKYLAHFPYSISPQELADGVREKMRK